MELKRFKDDEELVRLVSDWCRLKVAEFTAESIFLPAGNTPIPIYRNWELERPPYLKKLSFLQVDDIVSGTKANIFQNFFKGQLPSFLEKIKFISSDGKAEIADLAILGFGKNGHIAFHEPGVPENFEYGEVKLSESTRRNLGVEENDRAISYGAGSFVRCKAVLLIVAGEGKFKVFEKFLQDDLSVPATFLKKCTDLTILENVLP